MDASLWDELADPDPSDDWRLVLADRIGASDPERGAFVQLQVLDRQGLLTPAQRREMRRLLQKHLSSWLGPLRAVIPRGHLRFERGFLAMANVQLDSPRQAREVAGARQWTTVEALAGGRYLPTLLAAGVFPSLHTLGTAFAPGPDDTRTCPGWGLALRPDQLHGLRPPRLRGLQVDLSTPTRIAAFHNTFGLGSLQGLQEVGIRCSRPVHKGVLDALPLTVHRLHLDVPQRELDTWMGIAIQRFPLLSRLDVVLNANVVTLRREDDWRGLEAVGPIPPTWP